MMASGTSHDTTEITDTGAMRRTLAALRDSGETASLYRVRDGSGSSARLVSMAESPQRLVWEVAGSDTPLADVAGDVLACEAPQRAGHLVLSDLSCQTVDRATSDRPARLSTGWPSRLVLQHTRQEWRARLQPDEMPVSARLTQPELPPVNGWLRDFSTGGCRVAVAPDSRVPETGSVANLRLHFENGETVVLATRVSNVAADETEFGLAFVEASEEKSRRLSWLAREIDREFERNRQIRGELRPLAPSVLFMPATEDAE